MTLRGDERRLLGGKQQLEALRLRSGALGGHHAGDLDAVDEELGVDLQDVADLGASPASASPATVPRGSLAPAARHVHDPSSRELVSSMSILRGMRARLR